MTDNKRHNMLTTVGQVLTMYGANAPYKLVHDKGTRGHWRVMFKDTLDRKLFSGKDVTIIGWTTEYEGTFIECLDFIREYEAPLDKPF